MALLNEEDISQINVYKLDNDNDIYNIVRNYDINKLFDKLTIPTTTKEQLKETLKKALKEKDTDESLRILNYILKYKHNCYKRNDILIDDETPSSTQKDVILKDAGFYEIIFEGASAKSKWYSTVDENFTHYLIEGSPWLDSVNLITEESQRCLYLLKNLNYLFLNKIDDNVYELYFGSYELNDKGCFLFKKYKTTVDESEFKSVTTKFETINNQTYDRLETVLKAFIEELSRKEDFQKLNPKELLEYFEYNSSAYAAYGTRQIFIERFKTLLYSHINKEHKVYLKGAGSGENDVDILDIKDSVIFDDVKSWLNSTDKTYEQKDYYLNSIQTKNLCPTGESAYLSTIINVDSNKKIGYLLKGFDDEVDSSLIINDAVVIGKPTAKDIDPSLFDRNNELSDTEDHKYVGHIFGFDYDNYDGTNTTLNAGVNGFIGGGKKGYGPHLSHQDNCYWCNGDNAHIKIRYLGDQDAIMKRVFFPSDSYSTGRRISLKGTPSSIENFEYIDIPSGSIIEFKYKCSQVAKSLNFEKCFATILRNNASVYDEKYGTYGYESELDLKTVLTSELLSKLDKEDDIFFKTNSEEKISLSDIYDNIDTVKQRWKMSDLFFNNSFYLKDSVEFLDFNIEKNWNYYTISFRVFDNMLLDFGKISDEVDYYNNVTLEGLDAECEDLESQKDYFNKSNVRNRYFIKEFTLKGKLQDRIVDDNLNTLYNKNYYDTVSFNSDESSALKTVIKIEDSERKNVTEARDNFHDYRVFCEEFEKVYITIKSGNQIDLYPINLNVDFGDYEHEKQGYINNFYFKRTAISEEQLYNKRISVKQGEFIYFKCEYNTCRVEIDKELSSMPEDTLIYPVNFDPFENKYYSLSPKDYTQEQIDNADLYSGYTKDPVVEGKTFQWFRFTTSNSSYDIIVFLKKRVVEINFLNDLFGQDLITKNYDNNLFEPNESFSFYVKLPHNCRISTYRYSDNMTYTYIEDEKNSEAFKDYFDETKSFESFISFYSGNSEKVIKNFKDYVYDLPSILGSYSGSRNIYEIFKSTFASIDKKVNYFSDDNIVFSFNAKYASSYIRISEDYIVGTQIAENFTGYHNNRILHNGLYRIVATSGNSGKGGNGGEITPYRNYAAIISGAGGGGLYGGNSGRSAQNDMVSPVDRAHYFFTLEMNLWMGVDIDFRKRMPRWIPDIHFSLSKYKSWTMTVNVPENNPVTLGLTMYLGVGSGAGGNGFYKSGTTDGDGSWFYSSLYDVLKDGSTTPLKASEEDLVENDDQWPINTVFNNIDSSVDRTKQLSYFVRCFSDGDGDISGKAKNTTSNGQLQGTNYFDNYFNERYRGAFFDAIIDINSIQNNKILFSSKIGSSGRDGLNGSNSSMDSDGALLTMPKDGISGQEGKPTVFELDAKSNYSLIASSYFTNIKDELFKTSEKVKLNKCLICGGVHDLAPQKSFDIPDDWKYNDTIINDYLHSYVNDTSIYVEHLGKVKGEKDDIKNQYVDFWRNYEIHDYQRGDKYTKWHSVPICTSTFGSFAYVFFQWFWLHLTVTLRLTLGITDDFSQYVPLEIDFLDGFRYLINYKDYEDTLNVPVKYKPKLLPLSWDTKSHTIYTVSASNSKLSSEDVIDKNFSNYSPSLYLERDNNSHFQAPYPLAWPSSPYVSESSLNNIFDTSTNGEKYSTNFKKNLYNYLECYKNFDNENIWNDKYNIYKNDTLCVSNIGLTKQIDNTGSQVNGRLLNLSTSEFKSSDSNQTSQISLDLKKVTIKKDFVYNCAFNIGDVNIEIPIDGDDYNLADCLNSLFSQNSISLYSERLEALVSGSPEKIVYSSEAFSDQKYEDDTFSAKYLKTSSKVIFKNKESLMGIFKLKSSGDNAYSVEKIGNFKSDKFILEIKKLNDNGKTIYSSKGNKTTFEMDILNDSINILTSYDNIIIKNGNDYYVIIYDINNSLFGAISPNALISGDNPKTELNYYLEYPSSRGRVPLINDSLLEITYLGRSFDVLNIKDKENHKIAYIYGGMLYQDSAVSQIKENEILYNDLTLIDENSEDGKEYDYTALIDYKHVCTGEAILNSSQSEWLKI